jgi:hypothetical protein
VICPVKRRASTRRSDARLLMRACPLRRHGMAVG